MFNDFRGMYILRFCQFKVDTYLVFYRFFKEYVYLSDNYLINLYNHNNEIT
ncbi:MAG: hypothetical protein ACI9L6_000196 [Flavobacterium sp.]|jgi:hypothetical protein